MKSKILMQLILLTMSTFNILNCTGDHGTGKEKETLIYLVMIDNPEQERQADILIRSIRTFGGVYAASPVFAVVSDPGNLQVNELQGKADTLIMLDMNEELRNFPFSDKVFACAQVEKLVAGKADWLVWLNPDALMVSSPVEILAGKEAWASLRPVHIKNIGIGCTEPVTEYWKKIFVHTGVDTNALWPVESYVDSKMLKPYFNSGCMAFRPEKGILSEWKLCYERMLSDSALYTYFQQDQNGAIFFHQAVLSAVIVSKAGKERINMLPPSYGYPLSQQYRDDFIRKMSSITDMKIVLCEQYRNLLQLTMDEPYSSWVRTYCGDSL
jgi:hypothetical protein